MLPKPSLGKNSNKSSISFAFLELSSPESPFRGRAAKCKDVDRFVEDTGLANPSLLCTPFEDISARNMVQAARNGSLRILCSSDSLLPILLRRRFFETETGASRCIDEDGFAISNVFIVILSIE